MRLSKAKNLAPLIKQSSWNYYKATTFKFNEQSREEPAASDAAYDTTCAEPSSGQESCGNPNTGADAAMAKMCGTINRN